MSFTASHEMNRGKRWAAAGQGALMLLAVWVAFANAATVQEYGPIRSGETL